MDIAELDPGLAVNDAAPHAPHETMLEAEHVDDAHQITRAHDEPQHAALKADLADELRPEPPLAISSLPEQRVDRPPAMVEAGVLAARITPDPFHDDFIACASPATSLGLLNRGSLGPRGPPTRSGEAQPCDVVRSTAP